ncbi:hypothetical protein K439DRAFT_1344059 [Ramaria rubella]|nr:hypothetical protein K439DRAFT_1344059 [Ramaria rubella]
MREREEEIRRWEEELARFSEESARKQAEQRKEADHKRKSQQNKVSEEHAIRRSAVQDAWVRYEKQWQALRLVSSGLTFRAIPWPAVKTITRPESLHSHRISQFILSPDHSPTESRKRRIHTALLRWHTDHFDAKVMYKVVEADRVAVREGVGRVVRCLNEMRTLEGI